MLVRLIDQQNRPVSAQEIDQYLDALEEPKRTTLAQLRQTRLDLGSQSEGFTARKDRLGDEVAKRSRTAQSSGA